MEREERWREAEATLCTGCLLDVVVDADADVYKRGMWLCTVMG